MHFVRRVANGVFVALAMAAVAAGAATTAGAAPSANGPIAFAATVGQESRLFGSSSGTAPKQLTFHAQASLAPSWSPDGRRVVVTSPGGYSTASRLLVITLATGMERALTPLQPGIYDDEPTWSPDGRLVAFTRSRSGAHPSVMVVHADGSNPRPIYAGHSPAWAPDSRQIAFVNSNFIFRISAGGAARRLVRKLSRYVLPHALAWSPDGRRIAYAVESEVWWTGVDDHAVHSVRDFGPSTQPVFDMPAAAPPVYRVAWSVTGRRVLVALGRRDGSLGERLVSVGRDRPSVILLGQLDGTADSAWSVSRRRVAMTRNGVLWLADAAGTNARAVTPGAGSDRYPSYSPDGAMLAYANAERLILAAADGSSGRVLAPQVVPVSTPVWSRDGRSIAVWSAEPVPTIARGAEQLFTVDIASGAASAVSPILYDGGAAGAPQWSPDGRSIAYLWTSDDGDTVGAVSTADGAIASAPTPGVAQAMAWLPDGSGLLISYRDPTTGQLLLVHFDPGSNALTAPAPVLLAGQPVSLAWSPDGGHVALGLRIGDRGRVAVMKPDGSDAQVLDADNPLDDVLAGWSPDGKRLLVTRGDLKTAAPLRSVWSLGIATPGDARQETPAGLDAFDPTWRALPAA